MSMVQHKILNSPKNFAPRTETDEMSLGRNKNLDYGQFQTVTLPSINMSPSHLAKIPALNPDYEKFASLRGNNYSHQVISPNNRAALKPAFGGRSNDIIESK